MKKIIKIIYIFLLLTFSYFMFNWVMSAVIHKRKEVIMPKIEGKSIYEALNILSQTNLGLQKIGEDYNETLPHGTIVKQIPAGGMIVREGKIVNVIISLGGKTVFVPDLKNQTLRKTEIILRANELEIGEIKAVYSLKVEKNKIISQHPLPNVIVPKNSKIDLIVSKGLPPPGVLLMPDFVGKDISVAENWAIQNKIKYSIIEQTTSQIFLENVVFHQEPPPDFYIEENTNVCFFLPSGSSIEDKETLLFSYLLPEGEKDVKVKFVLLSEDGEKEIFNSIKPPGTKIELHIPKNKNQKIRIFINDVLIEERIL